MQSESRGSSLRGLVRCQLSGIVSESTFWRWSLHNAPFTCFISTVASYSNRVYLHLPERTRTHTHTHKMSLFGYCCRCLDTHHLPPQQQKSEVKSPPPHTLTHTHTQKHFARLHSKKVQASLPPLTLSRAPQVDSPLINS